MGTGPSTAAGAAPTATAGRPSTNTPTAAGTSSTPTTGGAAGSAAGGSAAAGSAAGGAVAGSAAGGAVAGSAAGAAAAGQAGSATTGGAAGGAAGGGATFTPDKCGAASTQSPADLHAAAASVLLPSGTNMHCAFSSCHSTSGKRAMLILEDQMADLHTLLVDKMPCEAPNLKLVDSRGGDAALANSWLWQKLTAPADTGEIRANMAWGTPGSCGQQATGTYGQRMPVGTPDGLPQESLEKVRAWICAGAPGR